MTSRAEIVAALQTVPGLTVTESQPDAIAAGSAWPLWRSTRWRNQVRDGIRELGWYVVVALTPGADSANVAEADPLVELVGGALADAELGVELVEPYRIRGDGTDNGWAVLRFTIGDRS